MLMTSPDNYIEGQAQQIYGILMRLEKLELAVGQLAEVLELQHDFNKRILSPLGKEGE